MHSPAHPGRPGGVNQGLFRCRKFVRRVGWFRSRPLLARSRMTRIYGMPGFSGNEDPNFGAVVLYQRTSGLPTYRTYEYKVPSRSREIQGEHDIRG